MLAVRLLALWLINTVSLIAVAYLMPSIRVSSFAAALVAALALGLVNAVLRPILVLKLDYREIKPDRSGALRISPKFGCSRNL